MKRRISLTTLIAAAKMNIKPKEAEALGESKVIETIRKERPDTLMTELDKAKDATKKLESKFGTIPAHDSSSSWTY